MNTATVIERHESADGVVQLQRRGGDYEVIVNGVFLMATSNDHSARTLVRAACRAADRPAHVVIGGLGIGSSLAEALDTDGVEKVTVIEIDQRIIEWNRTHLAGHNGGALDDPRVTVVHGDVRDWLGGPADVDRMEPPPNAAPVDVVCLDTDNGPQWLVRDDNAELYAARGLELLVRRVTPDGVAAFWSAAHVPEFAARLAAHFDEVDRVDVDVPRGEPDRVYVARRVL